MAILHLKVKSAAALIEKVKELMTLYRRFTPHRYLVCMTADGITFVPLVSSRHAHTVNMIIEADSDGTEYEKAVEALRKMGFKVFEECMYRPEPA